MENIVINEFLIESLNKQYGKSLTEEIIEGYKCKRYTTLRINTLKASKEDVLKELDELGSYAWLGIEL